MNTTASVTRLGLALACGAVVLLGVACSAPSADLSDTQQESNATKGKGKGTDNDDGTTQPGEVGKDKPAQSTPVPGTDGGTATVDPDQACYSKGADACETCCEDAHPVAYAAYENAYDTCICGTAGKCVTECAKTYCDDDGPDEVEGDACSLCQEKNAPEDGTGPCDAPILAALNATPDGVQLNHCWEECP